MLFLDDKFYPRENPRYTLQEEVERSAREMRDAIERMKRFEEKLEKQFEETYKNVATDNAVFKSTFTESHRMFLEAVKTEINAFESAMNSFKRELEVNFSDLSDDTKSRISDAVATVTNSLNNYKSELNNTYDAFRDSVESRLVQYNITYETAFNDFARTVNNRLSVIESKIN